MSEESDLPRPLPALRWYALPESWEVRIARANPNGGEGETTVWLDTPEDAAAIAALPEWIEDRDRWKARAEQAEAALTDVLRAARTWRGDGGVDAGVDASAYPIPSRADEAGSTLCNLLSRHGLGEGCAPGDAE